MHEADVARRFLTARPIEGEIIEIIAEIGSRRARCSGGKGLRAQMLGESRCRHLCVETRVFKGERACCARHRAARILPQVDYVVRRTLDAETFGAFTQAEMQDEARAMLVKEVGTESRDLCPFGGKHLSLQCGPKTGRGVVRCQRLCQPGRGIFGDTRKRAEPGYEQVPASHAFGLSRAKRRREGHFV